MTSLYIFQEDRKIRDISIILYILNVLASFLRIIGRSDKHVDNFHPTPPKTNYVTADNNTNNNTTTTPGAQHQVITIRFLG